MQNINTNSNLQETTKHGKPDFPLEFYIDDTRKFYNNDINWHWHKEFEIACISEGIVTCQIEQKTYILHPGEGIFINSGTLHHFTSENYGVMPNIVFSPVFLAPVESLIYRKYVLPIENAMLPCFIFKQQETWQKHILDLCGRLFRNLASPERQELLIHTLLSEIWLIMTEHLSPKQLTPRSGILPSHSERMLPVMLAYIQTHYASPITLTDIAAAANISPNTALRYFRQNIGVSPVEYLIQYRILTACKMLRESSDKIASISVRVGYDNISYFCRIFKKYVGKSPSQYRIDQKTPATLFHNFSPNIF